MIRANDRIELPVGVHVQGSELVDDVRGVRVPLNPVAVVALRESTPASMATALRTSFRVEHKRAQLDALALCARLNAALFANVRVAAPRLLARWLCGVLMLAPLRRVPPWPPRRRAVHTSSVMAAVRTVGRGAAGAAAVVSLVTALPLAAVGAPVLGCSAGLAAGTGLVLHEVAHGIALRGSPAALIVRGVRVSLLHPKLDRGRERMVAAAGPLAVVAAALIALSAVYVFAAASAAPVAVIFALHAVGLTVLAPDGRKLCVLC